MRTAGVAMGCPHPSVQALFSRAVDEVVRASSVCQSPQIIRDLAGCICTVALIIAVPLGISSAGAQYARLGLKQFSHTRWRADDGVPAAGVGALAQTPDGWLWITSAEGLFRLDGVTFEKIPAPIGSAMERAPPRPCLSADRENYGSAMHWAAALQNIEMANCALCRLSGSHPIN